MKKTRLLMLVPLLALTSCYNVADSKESYIQTYVRNIEREFETTLVHIQTKYEIEENSFKFAWVKIDEKTLDIHKIGDQITIQKGLTSYKFVQWGWNYD